MGDLVGQILGNKYQLVSLLDRGGMADVYKAIQPGVDRPVAIKVPRERPKDDPDFIDRFEREANVLARLSHPHIVTVYDFDAHGEQPYIAMEFIGGGTLQARLRQRNAQKLFIDFHETASILADLAGAIDYAHAQGMIHRDLKPANIMFAENGRVVLTDFGIAFMLGAARQTASGMIIGTPTYMAPEQCRGDRGDERSDIYALGVILYELVTGVPPFQHENPAVVLLRHIQDLPCLPSEKNPDISPAMERVILQALHKNPAHRYQDADSLAAALFGALDTGAEVEAEQSTQVFSVAQKDREKFDLLPGTGPFQVPAEIVRFVGRETALDDLYQTVLQDWAADSKLICLTGMGGVGKTALAVHLAHRLRKEFPDGVLWANAATSEPLAILDSWARAYACDFSSLPDLNSRAAALRGLLAEKRVLIVLDDVHNAAAVRLLFPGGNLCTILLTTRDLELAVALNAKIYPIGPLAIEESIQLLEQVLGPSRVQAEKREAEEICVLLGHLPLAVEIAAQRLHPRRWQLADLAKRLRDEKSRLDELKLSDREVRASFLVSWNELNNPRLQRFFACLGVFEGRRFDLAAAAAITAADEAGADNDLYNLANLFLVSEEERGWYRQHPLLADFARERLGREVEAYQRMARYYLSFADAHRTEYAMLEKEWGHCVAGLRTAYKFQLWQLLLDYANALELAWFTRGYYTDARQAYAWACEAAQALGNQAVLAKLLHQWGKACIEQNDYAEAERHLAASLELCVALDDQPTRAANLVALARAALEQTRYEEAQRYLSESRQIREQLGDEIGVAETLRTEARIMFLTGNYEKTQVLAIKTLTIQEKNDDQNGILFSLGLLTDVAIEQNNLDAAENYGQRALKLGERLGNKVQQAMSLDGLSHIYTRKGNPEMALSCTQQSLELLTATGDRGGQALVLYQLSIIHESLGTFDKALEIGQQSLALSKELNNELLSAYLLTHLGDVYNETGCPEKAIQQWQAALEIAEKLQHPTAIRDAQRRLGLPG